MKENNLMHNVFITLKDPSDAAIEKLIEDSYTYLKSLPGITQFFAGRLVEDHKRDVNVRDFHVGLHAVFSSKEYHDQYQVSENHNVFVERNKDNWTQVRVCDTYIQ